MSLADRCGFCGGSPGLRGEVTVYGGERKVCPETFHTEGMTSAEARRLASFSHAYDAALPPYPGLFALLLPRLVEVAREHGYALAVHGSMGRDLDLIACPWVESAADPLELVEAIRARVGGSCLRDKDVPITNEEERLWNAGNLTRKPMPHGRIGTVIHLGGGPYIDLSVMPRRASE